jgi:CHAT domain
MTDRFAHDVDRQMALAREWEELVARAREMPGFEDFLRPARLETLVPAAAAGPVVIVNVSRWRCDALIVRESGVAAIELPDLSQESVVEQARAYLDAVGARQHATLRGTYQRDLDPEFPADDMEARLDRCLRWMWDSFAARILDHLGYRATPADAGEWPRLWWCPTGPLTLLPIHAAGDHRTAGAAVLDRVVSSYTPTLRALVEAREGTASAGPGRMLFVGMPETPGQHDLPNVKVEEKLVERLFADRCTSLVGPDATRDTVLASLLEHSWVHFACHGEQDLGEPSRGGVIVHDGRLAVTDLSSQQYRGEFAYLSGCKTAVGGVNLPDEAITLAAALHHTGYRHVIATLWSVSDTEAAQVADDVYSALVHDGGPRADGAALALHRAVRQLRDRFRGTPSAWTPFAHIGP